jgi:hypothetical protein
VDTVAGGPADAWSPGERYHTEHEGNRPGLASDPWRASRRPCTVGPAVAMKAAAGLVSGMMVTAAGQPSRQAGVVLGPAVTATGTDGYSSSWALSADAGWKGARHLVKPVERHDSPGRNQVLAQARLAPERTSSRGARPRSLRLLAQVWRQYDRYGGIGCCFADRSGRLRAQAAWWSCRARAPRMSTRATHPVEDRSHPLAWHPGPRLFAGEIPPHRCVCVATAWMPSRCGRHGRATIKHTKSIQYRFTRSEGAR